MASTFRLLNRRSTSNLLQIGSRSSPFSSAPTPPPSLTKKSKLLRNLGITTLTGGAIWAYDTQINAEALTRTVRTAVFGVVMAADFKWNFRPEDSDGIDRLHERAAQRIYNLCVTNGGLYIKLAQSIAIQTAILPKPYRDAFGNIFDGAPSVSFEEVVKVFKNEFGVHPDEAFEEFERKPRASASIAQVHRARLKGDWKEGDGYVAVKIRKPAVPKQVEWDLFAYKMLLYTYERVFDLPVAFFAEYVTDQMRREIDLAHEAKNATETAISVANEPSLRDKVLIPRVEWEWTSKSVMTAEYIVGCKLTDISALAGYKLSQKETMDIATALFAAMMFKFGLVHCDPHPGNILVRPNPKNPKHPQIILIDHGLSVPLPEEFRSDYCLLWRSLFVADVATIEAIAGRWGISSENSDMFASMTLLRPHHLRKNHQPAKDQTPVSRYEAQTALKARLRSMLQNEELIPRELIFLTRVARMMQANNQALGSPTNRINVMAHWAVEGLKAPSSYSPLYHKSRQSLTILAVVRENFQNLIFRVAVLVIDIGFLITQVRQWVLAKTGTKTGEGFEDVLQRQVSDMARNEFGVELDDNAFAG